MARNQGQIGGWFDFATNPKLGSGNIIKFFSEMGKGAKAAAANVDSSAGVIRKALAGISGGAKGAWSSIGMFGKIGLVVAGISLVVGAVQKYKAHMKALRQEAAENAKAYNESQATLEDYAEKITELKTALDKGTLTEAEAYDAKKELYDIQTKLNESYGAAASGIDLVNGSLDEQIDKLHELSLEKANQYLNENKAQIERSTRAMTQTMGGEKTRFTTGGEYISQFMEGEYGYQALKKVIDKYKHLEVFKYDDGTTSLRFMGNVTQAVDELNDFMTDMRSLDAEFGGETRLFDNMFFGAQRVYDTAKETIEANQDTYNEAVRARMVAEAYSKEQTKYGDGSNSKTAAEWLDDYTASIKKYNDALSSGDSSQISEARSEFEQLDSTIQGLLADSNGLGYFSALFDDVANSLNTSAIAAQDFRESVSGSGGAKYLQNNGITQTQFSERFIEGLNTSTVTDGIVRDILQRYADAYGIDFADITIEQVERIAQTLTDMGVLVSDAVEENVTTTLADVEQAVKDASADTVDTIAGIQNAQKALSAQEAGKSISPSDFSADEMRDYASALEYVNGVYQLNAEKVNAIVEAKANEQIVTNDANKALAQQKYLENAKQIAKYREELEAARAAGDDSVETIESNIAALLKENSSLRDECNQYDLMSAALAEVTGAYQNWINAKNASEAGDMFDSTLEALKQLDDTLNNSDSDLFGRIGREDYKAAVDFVIPDTVDKEDSAAVNSYLQSISDMFTYDGNGNRNGLNIDSFIQKSVDRGLLVLNEAGTAYEIAGHKTMEDFANGLGLAMPLVRAMFGELQEFGAKFDWADEASKTIGDLAVQANESAEALRNVEQFKDLKIVMDVSEFDDADKACETLKSSIEQMREFKLKLDPDVDQEKLQQADDVIRYCVAQKQLLSAPAVMSVDVSKVTSEIAPALDLLQQFQNAQNNLEMDAAVGADTSEAEAKITGLVTEIQGLDPEILAKIGLDPTSEDAIQTYITNLDAEAIVNFGIDSSLVTAFEKSSHTASGTVKWYNDETNLKKYFYRIGYVTWKDANNPGGSGGSRANGSANAYGSARLRGDWRAHAGRALVGELGREIIVDPNTGRWYTVGDQGAEFVNIPEGAIIFNHRQSDALLENGRVTGRGQSYVSGSAFVTGYIPSGIRNNGSSSSGRNPGYSNPSGGASSSVDSKYDKELETFDWIEVAIDRIERVIERLSKVADSAFKSLKSRMNAASDEISMVTREIDLQQRAYDKYMSAAESVSLSSGLKELVRNGAIDISQYDEDTIKLINDYKDLYDKALDCSAAIDDLHESLAQLYKDKFDNIQGNYDNQLSLLGKQSDTLQRKIDKLEEQGYLQNANYYAQMQKIEQQNIQVLNKELADLSRAFGEAMASGEIEEGSDAWYEMRISIEDTKAAIDDAELSIIKYANSIRQISWDYFDYAQERISQITSEASFLQSLLDGRDMYDKNGSLSDAGNASMGLHAENYGVYMAQADKYADEIEKLNKELASDPSNKELIARRDELLASQRDSILAAKDEKDAMIDLAKNGIQVELDAVRELIDAYTDSLDSAKDLYDYQKKIAERTANISALEKQLAAYQNDMSEETRSKVQKIQLELKDAQDDLKDTEYDRFVSDAKKALESMYDEYEDLLNSRFDDVDALFEQLIGTVNDNYADINAYISKAASSVGYTITEATSSLWANGGGANGLVSVYGTDISTKLTSVGSTVENIFSVLEEIARANGVSFGTAKSYKSGGLVDYTGIANVHGSEDKPEMVLNADDTRNFILLRDAMRSGALSSMFGTVRIGNELSKIGAVDAAAISRGGSSDGYTVGSISVSIPIAHVNDYSDFVNQLRDDKQFEQLIQDVTIGRIAGKNSLSKNRHRW